MPVESSAEFTRRVPLGHTGLMVSRLGIGSSYGVGADAVKRAYHEHGINYLYWGTVRRPAFGVAIRDLASKHRDDLVVVVQTYTRLAAWMRPSLQRALRELNLDHADVLLLGMHNKLPSDRLRDAALKLRDSGLVRFLAVSCHRRTIFREYLRQGFFDILMFRYSAAHRGAESDLLALLPFSHRPGTVSYTATRWGMLLDPANTPAGERTPSASDCYRFVLSHPGIDVCLTGPADDRQLAGSLEALRRGPMSPDEIGWMRRVGDDIHARIRSRGLRGRLFQQAEA
jgi:aryl-alcohol dehydrogenase-like predicted oxidoreductase